ncbi:MAG: hypothetical protein ACOX8Q_07305 [Christensenellales bacterium]|jgi:hypothetical protein
MEQATRNGDTKEQEELTVAWYEANNSLGRGVQANQILYKSSPSIHLLAMECELAKLNNEGFKKLGAKWTDVAFTSEERQAILDGKTADDRECQLIASDEAYAKNHAA